MDSQTPKSLPHQIVCITFQLHIFDGVIKDFLLSKINLSADIASQKPLSELP